MSITRRVSKDGKVSYRVKVHLGYEGENGKGRRTVTKTCATKKEALVVEAQLKTQVEQGTLTEPNRITVAHYLEEWLEKSVKVKLKRQTYELYRNIVRIYIVPTLGITQLAKLTPLAIEGLYIQLGQGEKARAPQTIKNVHTVIRGSLKQAVRWRYLAHSPALDVDSPRVDNDKKVRSFDPDQAQQFLRVAANDRWGLVLVFALITGARPGEYLALLWDDLNWKEGTVRIERTLVRPKGGGWFFDTPKTKKSYRTVLLTPELLELLRQHRARQREARRVLGDTWQAKEDFMFTNDSGGPIDEKHLHKRSFKSTLAKAGLPRDFRLYDLRHTCSTLLLLAGEPAKVVSERLGHASVTTTLDTYSHVLPHLQQRATEKLRFLLGPELGSNKDIEGPEGPSPNQNQR
jgi:integrase